MLNNRGGCSCGNGTSSCKDTNYCASCCKCKNSNLSETPKE